MMAAVVDYGTGQALKGVPGGPVHGKTGTSRVRVGRSTRDARLVRRLSGRRRLRRRRSTVADSVVPWPPRSPPGSSAKRPTGADGMTNPDASDAAAYPREWETHAVLADGATVEIRPILPSDREALVDFHGRQSPESIYFRFFRHRPELSDRELDFFTQVDYRLRMSFVAIEAERLVAVASYEHGSLPESVAEVAFFVDDANHGRGLATLLLEYLAAAARANGFTAFTASVLPRELPDAGRVPGRRVHNQDPLRGRGHRGRHRPHPDQYQSGPDQRPPAAGGHPIGHAAGGTGVGGRCRRRTPSRVAGPSSLREYCWVSKEVHRSRHGRGRQPPTRPRFGATVRIRPWPRPAGTSISP